MQKETHLELLACQTNSFKSLLGAIVLDVDASGDEESFVCRDVSGLDQLLKKLVSPFRFPVQEDIFQI